MVVFNRARETAHTGTDDSTLPTEQRKEFNLHQAELTTFVLIFYG